MMTTRERLALIGLVVCFLAHMAILLSIMSS